MQVLHGLLGHQLLGQNAKAVVTLQTRGTWYVPIAFVTVEQTQAAHHVRAQMLQHCSTEPFLRRKFSAKPCNTPNVILGAYQIPLRIVKEFNDL